MKNKNLITINQWNEFSYKLNSQNIIDNLIKISLSSFHSEVIQKLFNYNSPCPNNIKLAILFKVKTVNNQYRNIGPMQIIGIDEFQDLKELFIEYWDLKTEEYFLAEYSNIIYVYKIIDNNIPTKIQKPNKDNYYNEHYLQKNVKTIKFGGYNLPNTMDFTLWGNYHFFDLNHAIVYKNYSILEYHIKLFDNYQEVELKYKNKTILSFKDIMLNKNDLTTFTRIIKNQEYIFEDGELVLKKIEKNVSFLTKIRKSLFLSTKFITMDLETRVINEEMTSYCVSIYDGKIFKSFYLSDYKNEKDMLRESIKYLMIRKYHNYKVYLHNFSKFDAVFLLSCMSDLSDEITPLMKDGRFIDLKLEFGNKYSIYFRDSLLLLPSSLKSLAINFNVENKGFFPYKFVNNKDIKLDYDGIVPEHKYFDKVSGEEYTNYCKEFHNKKWNLKKETIKYCELDCLVLYQIIDKFSKNIFKLFRINIFKYPTLASLAFAIFRAIFLKGNTIPLILGEMYEFIKKSYTGGSVDVYRSTIDKGNSGNKNKVHRYDVNSLYPYAMKNYPMPVGKPIYFEGDIFNKKDLNNDKPFGIFEVDIECPENMKIPLLQIRIKTKNGYRTIAPIGNWSGYYFSDELYNAQKYGYKFKVKRGYLFEKGDIFKEYVDFLYDLKKKSKKGSPNYIISKLLLNSLYGRLGMSPLSEQHLIISSEKANDLYSKLNISNVLALKNGKELISFFNPVSEFEDSNFNIKNISVAISSVVTASARIHMSQFKTNKNLTIYYTDTDSIDIDQELENKFVGDELGQMKLEHVFDDAVFLGPKMYGGINKEYEYVRIKGLKNTIPFDQLKPLLKKDSKLKIPQEKWYSDISNGMFHVKNEIYTLMVTDNKRKLIYNDNNEFIDTLPLKLKDGILIDTD